jgi:2-oxoglutarate dehydrogenase E1 component
LLRRQMKTTYEKNHWSYSPKVCFVTVGGFFCRIRYWSFQETIDWNKKWCKTLVSVLVNFITILPAERETNGRKWCGACKNWTLFLCQWSNWAIIKLLSKCRQTMFWALYVPRNMGACYLRRWWICCKLRVASLKTYSAPAAGSYMPSSEKRLRSSDCNGFDKNLF